VSYIQNIIISNIVIGILIMSLIVYTALFERID